MFEVALQYRFALRGRPDDDPLMVRLGRASHFERASRAELTAEVTGAACAGLLFDLAKRLSRHRRIVTQKEHQVASSERAIRQKLLDLTGGSNR